MSTRQNILSAFLVLATLLNFSCSDSSQNNQQVQLLEKLTMTDVLNEETTSFQEGIPIFFQFSLENLSNVEAILKFKSSLQIEVVIRDSNLNQIRRLSDNFAFLQVLTEVLIAPFGMADFPIAPMNTEQLAVGNYSVTVTVVDNDIEVTRDFTVVKAEPLLLSVSLIVKDSFDQPVNIFNQGEIITFELQLKNEGLQKAILVFNDSQTHDVIITNPQTSEQIWELEGVYAAVVTYIAIEPGETIIRSDNFDQVLTNGGIIQSGTYDVKAWYKNHAEVQEDAFTIQ